MTKEGSIVILNFLTPGAGVLMLGRDHISLYSKNVSSSTQSIYSTLIANVLWDNNTALLFHFIVDFYIFYIFYDGVVDMLI